jgi:hypothetical protein
MALDLSGLAAGREGIETEKLPRQWRGREMSKAKMAEQVPRLPLKKAVSPLLNNSSRRRKAGVKGWRPNVSARVEAMRRFKKMRKKVPKRCRIAVMMGAKRPRAHDHSYEISSLADTNKGRRTLLRVRRRTVVSFLREGNALPAHFAFAQQQKKSVEHGAALIAA